MSINTKFAVITVVREQAYLVPMEKRLQTEIGLDINQILDDWFKNPNQYHATRDSFKLGGADKILRIFYTLPDGTQHYHIEQKITPETEQGLRVMYEGLKEYFEEKTGRVLKKKFLHSEEKDD